jgi:uncharacterized membrane protein YfcA
MAGEEKTVGDHVLVILFLLLLLLVAWTYWFRSRPRTTEVDIEVRKEERGEEGDPSGVVPWFSKVFNDSLPSARVEEGSMLYNDFCACSVILGTKY